MSDLAAALITTPGWPTLQAFWAQNVLPHAWAIHSSVHYAQETVGILVRHFLCERFCGGDGCPSCMAWHGTAHPDLMELGTPGVPPGIDECRKMAIHLALTPVAGKRRIAVIFAADRMSPPAANSLLKIVEEPPSAAILLLMVEMGALLPTLRSRTQNLDLRFQEHSSESFPLPGKDMAWIPWMVSQGSSRERRGNSSPEELRQGLAAWSSMLASQGSLDQAEALEIIRALGEGQRLSMPMLQDLICLALKEEYPIEDIFGPLW